EKHLSEPREAIDALRDAATLKPAERSVLVALDRLYRAEQMWTELLENLRAEVTLADSQADRVRLQKEIGTLHAKRLEDPNSALEAFKTVLDEVPDDADAIGAVTHIGETREELSLAAADILEPVLRKGSQWDKLVQVLEMRARAQSDPADKSATLKAIAEVL